MKKMLCAVALLMFTLPAMATPSPDTCTEITVRFTAFTMIARQASSKQQYDSALYKMLLEGNADKANQQILIKLIELGWNARTKDINETAMGLYHACMAPDAET